MMTLSIHFQDGFESHSVSVRIDGEVVHEAKNLRTSLLTGFAGSFTVEIPDAPEVLLEVTVGEVRHQQNIRLDEGAYVGVSLIGERIHFIQSTEEFGYG